MSARKSGVLMPISSLPSPYGIGTFGRCAYDFVDFLKAGGQKYWQVLPLGPTGFGDSPYSSFSTFAGNPYFIDPDFLISKGLLSKQDVESIDWGTDPENVDYGKIYSSRTTVLYQAYRNGKQSYLRKIGRFKKKNQWAENYALYMSLKEKFDMKCWLDWPDEKLKCHDAQAISLAKEALADRIDFYCFVQVLFFEQWERLKKYAHRKGISFIGDIPIYVALDSADVWCEPEQFRLDENHRPTKVAGVPPDAFTADGQLWGNPLYDWEKMKQDGYQWWIRRISGLVTLYDVIRIDHFRGLHSYWEVPAEETTAKNGVWIEGPGIGFVNVLKKKFPKTRFIAEDLGYLTDSVRKLVDDSGFPGMNILEFAFDSHGDSIYLPERIKKNSVCYAGTHDNDTIMGWLSGIDEEHRKFASDYMHITKEEGWVWGMIRTGMECRADTFVILMQDILELDRKARMNTPGTAENNWRWRMKPDAISKEHSEKLRLYTKRYNRM